MRAFSAARPALLVTLAAIVAGAAPGGAAPQPQPPPLVERVVHLEHQPAAAAIDRICPLLSARGSVAVQDGGRTLVVRDVELNAQRIVATLAAFDHAGRTVRLAVQIVSADSRASAAASPVELPAEVVARLRRMLRYQTYSLLARADVEASEEELSTFEVGSEFRVSFRLDRLAEPRRVRMREFRVLRKVGAGEVRPLVHTNLSLERGRPMILGLAPTEASERALVLVLEAAPEEARG